MIKKGIYVLVCLMLTAFSGFAPTGLGAQTTKTKSSTVKKSPPKKSQPSKTTKPAPAAPAEVPLPPMDSAFSYTMEYTQNGESYFYSRGRVFKNARNAGYDSLGNFAFIFTDKGKTFVNVNGKRIGPYDFVNGKTEADAVPVYVAQGGKYAFTYHLKGKQYVNINGKILGPYPAVELKSLIITPGGNYAFNYLLNQNSRYVMINEKKYGPFPNESNMAAKVFDDGTFFFEYSDKNGEFMVNINGQEYRMEDVDSYPAFPTRFFAFKKEGSWYVNNAGTISGPYGEVNFLDYNPSGGQASFKYRESGGPAWYLSDRGRIAGPYEKIEVFGGVLYHKNVPVFKSFRKAGQREEQYVDIDGKVMGPYNYTKRLTLLDRDNFIFAFENKNRWYVNLRGEPIRGSFGLIDDVAIHPNGTFAYSHHDKSDVTQSRVVINKKATELENSFVEDIFLAADGTSLLTINKGRQTYVNAFGKELGPFPQILYSTATDNGEYCLVAADLQMKQKLIIINGVNFGLFDKFFAPAIAKGGKYIFTGEIQGKVHLYINGEVKGPFDSIRSFSPTKDWKQGNLIMQ
jgi:hypothetical protein